ncbi:MAG: glycosyltransferase WbuB [Bacteroidetes bacterium HGW-Bacteroidetes-8]|jgi:glycosyltransferase involved in cell wall biosynthesis|nr:MAG: glycosyltransferase WbuB [Bacteroidetes bacterium HGW-Bacteroidetes-8]
MKVLYFHQHFTIPTGSGGTRSYEMAHRLVERGHKVIMVCGETSKLELPEMYLKNVKKGVIDGINVLQISLPYSNRDGIAKRTLTFLRFALLGIKIALNEKYDIVFATSTPLTAGIPGLFAKWFRGKKFVFEVRDLWPKLPKALGMKNPLLLWGMSFLEWISYRNADGCIGLSPGICDGIAKKSQKGKRIEMVPNGCDLNIFTPSLREPLSLEGIDSSKIVAVFTGAHGIANGLNAVLDVASTLKAMGRDDIVLAFIGDGKVKEKLVSRAFKERLDNCRFYDPVPKLQLNKIIASVDIGLMILANVPAFYYGTSPNKFFDYISSGLPVLNNYPGWLADIIQEHNCGFVIPPNDPQSFANELINLADNPILRYKMGQNARHLAESKFSRAVLANKFVDFLEKVKVSD